MELTAIARKTSKLQQCLDACRDMIFRCQPPKCQDCGLPLGDRTCNCDFAGVRVKRHIAELERQLAAHQNARGRMGVVFSNLVFNAARQERLVDARAAARPDGLGMLGIAVENDPEAIEWRALNVQWAKWISESKDILRRHDEDVRREVRKEYQSVRNALADLCHRLRSPRTEGLFEEVVGWACENSKRL